MRTGAEYLASLNDGREVVIDGEIVRDIARHPAFAGVCQTIAGLYDHIKNHHDEMTFPSPTAGKPVSLAHLTPRSIEDLRRRRHALTRAAEFTFGFVGRGPEHVASFFAGFASHPELFGRTGSRYAENIVRFQRKMRDEHLYVSYTIVPPQVDRSKTAHEQAESHIPAGVLKEVDGGIIIRGAQMLGTGAAISDYLFFSNIHPLRPGDEDYAVSLVVPLNAPGLRLYARRPYAMHQPSVYDYPLSTRYDESDSLVVFRDVFVPWKNVFVYRDLATARAQWFETPAHVLGNSQAQIRLAVKTKFIAGLARKICATNGVDMIPSVVCDLGAVASLAAIVEGMVIAAEATAVTNAQGIVHPNPRFLYGAMAQQSKLYPKLIHMLRELAGGGVLQVPSSCHEFSDPLMAADLERYIRSPGITAEERIKLFKLAWETTGSEFAGRHQQYEMFYAGAPFVAKTYSFVHYGYDEAVGLVDRCLSGYRRPASPELPPSVNLAPQPDRGATPASPPSSIMNPSTEPLKIEAQPFIPYVDEKNTPPELRPLLEPYVKRMGFLPNCLKLYMHRPEIAATLWMLNSNIMRDPSSTLDQGLKRRLGAVASRVNGCGYCVSHHCTILKGPADGEAEGWSMAHEELMGIMSGDLEPKDEFEKVCFDFVRAASADPHHLPDEIYDRLKALLTPPQIIELACVVGFWKMYNTIHGALRVPIEAHLAHNASYLRG
ncbi:MAG: 4-hydroxyphenylacetate 3-hydroxylase N-terminal domain-containing protein [Opitutaceae bacterium]|nr:4-hydroxyphenylacetate 3-hydroxylase N-terminal domain-containing protein [Opitutaceae bacterium]